MTLFQKSFPDLAKYKFTEHTIESDNYYENDRHIFLKGITSPCVKHLKVDDQIARKWTRPRSEYCTQSIVIIVLSVAEEQGKRRPCHERIGIDDRPMFRD